MVSTHTLEIRVSRLEGVVEQLDHRLGDLASRIDTRFGQVDARIDSFRESLDKKIDGLQWRMTALIVGTWIATMAAILIKH